MTAAVDRPTLVFGDYISVRAKKGYHDVEGFVVDQTAEGFDLFRPVVTASQMRDVKVSWSGVAALQRKAPPTPLHVKYKARTMEEGWSLLQADEALLRRVGYGHSRPTWTGRNGPDNGRDLLGTVGRMIAMLFLGFIVWTTYEESFMGVSWVYLGLEAIAEADRKAAAEREAATRPEPTVQATEAPVDRSLAGRLQELEAAKEAGLVTDDEFQATRAAILAQH